MLGSGTGSPPHGLGVLAYIPRCVIDRSISIGPLVPALIHTASASRFNKAMFATPAQAAADDAMLVRGLAKRGYLDVLKRRVPLYRLSDLAREALQL